MHSKYLLLLALGLFALVRSAPSDDLVTSLDQMPDLSFGMYSGYLPIGTTAKKLHYVAALSQNDPATDPVIVWFNGGPGCSSMLGWAQEHGPYVMEDGTDSFVHNDYAWNMEANLFYIESPAGVGFSVCGKPEECKFDDNNSAEDNLLAILSLFTDKFPELQRNPLWISGESYAGVYVPQVTKRLQQYIEKHTGETGVYLPNLKGMLVGNGVTNWKYDGTPAYFHMAYYHGIIDDALYNAVNTNCDISYYDFDNGVNLSDECKAYMLLFTQLTDKLINIYDVYGKCYQSPTSPQLYSSGSYLTAA